MLEPRLQICLCTRSPHDGDLCTWCGCHAGVTSRKDTDAVCYCDDCHAGVTLYTAPLPLEPAKIKDLHTLSIYLQPYMSLASIAALYPCPDHDSEDDDFDGEEDSDNDKD